jgi:hypothetical protein
VAAEGGAHGQSSKNHQKMDVFPDVMYVWAGVKKATPGPPFRAFEPGAAFLKNR